ncbi:conserved hypothetical protein [Mycoplasmopsis pulmonis]|uniref:ComEC/Rec2-related protein domain-containing protein n=1 Tax=Mycoplasmopsis pulmonis (strain UAB CTIP) TaxID=272635 RepID=Q98QA5_MYCPU|nr:conserved hypothetical protein [Mycoplasmopsis pulmonis]
MKRNWFNKWHRSYYLKYFEKKYSTLNTNFYLFFPILFFLFFNYSKIFLVIITILFFVFSLKKIKKLIYFSISLSICFFSIGINRLYLNKTNLQVEANYAISQKYKNGYVIQNNFQRILLITNKDLDQNFIYKIKGKQEKLDNSNYANFLKSNFVFSTIKTKEITKTFSNKSFRNKIKNYFENSPSYYQKYVPLILLNHKSQINQKEYKSIENLGIVHLVVISGFHINLIFWLLNFAFNKVKIKPFYSNFFSIFLISSLVILLGISMPIYRVLFFYYFKFFYESFIYKKGKVKISKIQILLISLVAIFTINPNVIFSLSTIFTYSITFVILWSSKFKFKNKILKALFISFLAYATSALILIIFQNKIYPFAFFYSIIFSPIISFVFIVSVLFFWLKNFIDFIYLIFDKLIQSLNTFSLVWELKF